MDRKQWGRVLESSVGAYIIGQAFVHRFEVYYWRDKNDEVDFVLRKKNSVVAIEVKGNAEKNTAGLERFKQLFHPTTAFIVGDGGIGVEAFMQMNLGRLF